MNYNIANLHESTVNTKFNLSLGCNYKITVSFSSSDPFIHAPSGDSLVYVGSNFWSQVGVGRMHNQVPGGNR